VLLIGDATGARQDAEHKWSEPTSYKVFKADGWLIQPPMYHFRHNTPWNPLVRDSRAQLHLLFERNRILISEKCREPCEGFSSLVESLRRAKASTRPMGCDIWRGSSCRDRSCRGRTAQSTRRSSTSSRAFGSARPKAQNQLFGDQVVSRVHCYVDQLILVALITLLADPYAFRRMVACVRALISWPTQASAQLASDDPARTIEEAPEVLVGALPFRAVVVMTVEMKAIGGWIGRSAKLEGLVGVIHE
jgi:hypothetical protein